MNDCPVITAVDSQYVPYLAVLAASLAQFGKGHRLVVIYRGLSKEARCNIERLVADRLSLKWEAVTPVALESVNLSLLDDLEPYYFRLLAPTLLATEERAVYLDADILVRADPTPLLRWPLKGHPIAAVQDDYLRKIKHAISNYSDWGLDPELPYFNSGVMVMDLEWWRRENVANHVLTTCRSNSAYLRAQGQWPTYDQYGLNVVFANRWSVLPKIWNHSSLYPDDGACIVHFLGIGRPDSQSCHSIFREEFFALLAKTPWRGIIRFEQ